MVYPNGYSLSIVHNDCLTEHILGYSASVPEVNAWCEQHTCPLPEQLTLDETND